MKIGNQRVKKESYQLVDHQHMIKLYCQCLFLQLEIDMMYTFIVEIILNRMLCILLYSHMQDMVMH